MPQDVIGKHSDDSGMPSSLTAVDQRRFSTLSARLERGELGVGANGGAVKALESVLTTLGFTPGTVDTSFDARTQGTLKNFQSSMGLKATGTLDVKTLDALKRALTAKRADPSLLQRGQKSDAIARAERQLAALGYDVGAKDGIADASFARAVKGFKADQPTIKSTTGRIGADGLEVLAKEAGALRHAPYRGRFALTKEQQRQDTVLASLSERKNVDGTVGLGEGGARPAVQMLQTRLKAAGFDPKHVDGVFDERTRGALEAFQRASGVPVTGRLDPATWKRLSKSIINTADATAPLQALHEKSKAVRATEQLLTKAGFKPGDVDGLFSKQTEAAVRAFEKRAGRTVDGRIGAGDLLALKKLAQPFREPKADYRHLSWRGVTASGRTIELVNQAEAWAAKRGVKPGWPLFQGSYNHGVGASAGTHDGGGALDFNTEGRSLRDIRVMVEALRRAGFAAWHRPWSDDHIHAIAIGDRDLSSEARSQVAEYFRGGDGLVGSAPDPHSGIGRPVPDWAKRFRP